MLNEALLLDSTRPVGNLNNLSGCPEHSFLGVPSSCQERTKKAPSPALSWYALRVSYSRELKVQSRLNELGIRTFVPMVWKNTVSGGKQEKKLVPAVGNLCFVLWDRASIEEYISSYGEDSPVHFYWDRTANSPVVVPHKAMEDFITVASAVDQDILYIQEILGKLREGQKVVVTDGPFKGVRGKVVRIRKSRRVIVELPGLLAAATTYIPPQALQIID